MTTAKRVKGLLDEVFGSWNIRGCFYYGFDTADLLRLLGETPGICAPLANVAMSYAGNGFLDFRETVEVPPDVHSKGLIVAGFDDEGHVLFTHQVIPGSRHPLPPLYLYPVNL